MKLLLLQPPVRDFYDTDIRLQPIGLCYLKAAVRRDLPDVDVVVRDFHHGWGRRTVPVPAELAYLKDFYAAPDKGPFSTFHNYYHFGAGYETIAENVARERPDLVGISSLFSPYYREALAAAGAIKARLGVPILAGGSHVSALPELMLGHPAVDFAIRGEGERPLVEFLKAWLGGRDWAKVPNLGFKRNGSIVLNAMQENDPLDRLGVPDFSDFSPEDYLFEGAPLSSLCTSRGCPHRCNFCPVHVTFGRGYRKRRVPDILEEIRARYGAGCRVFDFEDDNLSFDLGGMKELCRRLAQEFGGKDVRFLAMNGISYLSLDAELLGLMKNAGFTDLNVSLVSADAAILGSAQRPHTFEKYLEVVDAAFSLGFRIVSYQILGLPDETLDSMVRTLALNARLPVLLGASMFYLAPGSALAQKYSAGTEADIFKARLTAMAFENERFGREDIYTLFVTSRIVNFLKGLPVERDETRFEDALALAGQSDKRSAWGAQILRRLLAERILFASTSRGFKPLPKFRFETFERVWSCLDFVATREGRKILLA